jgi:hypothetical protein
MKFFNLLKTLFAGNSIKTEKQLQRMDKDELETYARTLGLELDKRHNKETLIQQILEEQKYYE